MNEPPVNAPADCYSPAAALLPPAEAERRIRALVQPVRGRERLALRDALGRVLAESVHAPHDVPGHTNSAMDGYAIAGDTLPAEGETGFDVVGTAWAGRPHDGAVTTRQSVRVMTGAVMPQGTDTVVMQEQVRVIGDTVWIGGGHRRGQNVRLAGEDLQRGAEALAPGKTLMPAELGLLASLGVAEVSVFRRPRVAFFSTGDELRSLGQPLDEGCVYDSNRYTLYGMLHRLGVEVLDLGVVRDRPGDVRDAFEHAAAMADVVITSGGVSTGEADYVQRTLAEIGEVGFWRIAVRPGRPLAVGRVREALFFGLPGNPVAVMVTFYQFVQPALLAMMGDDGAHRVMALRVRCVSRLRKKPGRIEYYRAVLERDENGETVVASTGDTGSGLLHTMSDANCFIVLPVDGETVQPGELVDVQPFFGLV